MTVKELIRKLSRFDGESVILSRRRNWYEGYEEFAVEPCTVDELVNKTPYTFKIDEMKRFLMYVGENTNMSNVETNEKYFKNTELAKKTVVIS